MRGAFPLQRPQERKKQSKEITSPHHAHLSLVKKSVALSTSMWIRTNSRQVTVFVRSGAGEMLCRLRMLPTVWSLTV